MDGLSRVLVWRKAGKVQNTEKMAESVKTPPFLPEHCDPRNKVLRGKNASTRPSAGPGRARDKSLRGSLYGILAGTKR
jgi:hypothetical protein